ncbi:MAG: redox-sensing transcriptional repressor Rex [Candidatus Omnitrophota bacterium]|jgi:redox-sensing transcriptional repressor
MAESKDFISRLLKYKNVLTNFKKLGMVKVFSDNLGDATGLSSSQVRKDFSAFKITGNKRGGYDVDSLVEKLNQTLIGDRKQKVIVVGCGNIGRALIEYNGFHGESLKIVAGFDISKSKWDPEAKVPIYPLERMEEFVKKNQVKVGVIAVPEHEASSVCDKMIAAGIKGVLNFARVYIRETEGTVIDTVNIELKIENLFYFVNALSKEHDYPKAKRQVHED